MFFHFCSPEAIIPEELFVLTFQLSFSFIPLFRSSVLLSARYLFVLLHLNTLVHIFLLILTDDSFPLIDHIRILIVVPSDSFSFVIILIHSFFPILPVVHEDLLKFAICHFSILFKRNKLHANIRLSSIKFDEG